MVLSHFQCFWCHQLGHYASNYPVPNDKIIQMQDAPESTEQSDWLDNESDHVQLGIMATTYISLKSTVLKMWILLDNTSTVKIFFNPLLDQQSGWQSVCYASFVPLELPTLIT